MIDKIKLYERQEILNKRVHKLGIIQKDIYPVKFNVVTKLINKNEKKITIINKILNNE